jgi:hypothetical protein
MFQILHVCLSTIAIALSGVGNSLAFLDWISSKDAKKWIDDKFSTALDSRIIFIGG